METYYPPSQWEEQGNGYRYRYDYLERVVDTISPLKEHQRVYRNFDGDITRTIKDPNVTRLVRRMLKSGTMENYQYEETEKGSGQ